MKKVIVAMSGGVDSSVTALILKNQGYVVEGMTMRLGIAAPGDPATEAAKVAAQIGIAHHVVDLSETFNSNVITPFCQDYLSGRTPNPCVLCNKTLKFGSLLQEALKLGADYLATGHYVRLIEQEQKIFIRKAEDLTKDQSYFLFALDQQQLEKCLFPLGSLTKKEVRAMAEELNLDVAHKSESQDICFIPDGDYVGFLKQRGTPETPGDIVHVDGRVVGRHQGIYRYTIGQRKGLGIGWSEPLYVVSLDAAANRVIVGERDCLQTTEMFVDTCQWSAEVPHDALNCRCRIRYRHQETPARVEPAPDGGCRVLFEEPQFGVTPGQAAVFYQDDRVIGGGWIR